jgi:MFS family permease
MMAIKRFAGSISFRRYNKGVWAMITIRFISMLGYAIFGPYLMLYFNQDRGLTMTLTGLIIALSGISGAITQILGGAFTDRFGRRKTLLLFFSLNLTINAILTLMVALAAPVWSFAIVYIVSGAIWGMIQPAILAVITDLTPKENLTEAFGMAQLIVNIGWIFGPVVGGFMFSHLSFTYLMSVTVITSSLCLLLSSIFRQDSFDGKKDSTSLRGIFIFKSDVALITYIILNMLVFLVYVQITGAYSVFSVKQLGFTATQYGLLLMINGILAVVFQYPVTRWVTARLGDKSALIMGSVVFGLAYLSLAWITTFGWSIAAIIAFTAAELLFVPSATSIVGKLADEDKRGRYMGLLGTGTGLGIALAPLLGGALFDASQGTSILLWGPLALIAFISGIGFLRWFSAYKKRLP